MPTPINRSLAHGMEILLLFGTSKPVLAVSEISKRLNFTQSKTYRLVKTLIRYGFLRKIGRIAQYGLGLNAIKIGSLALQSLDLSHVAIPFMKELSLVTKETILLTVVCGTRGICLERVDSEHPIRYAFARGGTFHLHCGASAKILMAFLPEGEWDNIISKEGLKRYTSNTITQKAHLKLHLREIRKRGYAISDQEVGKDVRGVAAPIFNGFGELVGGLGVVGPAYRINRKKMTSFAALTMEYAQKLSLALGFSLQNGSERPKGQRMAPSLKSNSKVSCRWRDVVLEEENSGKPEW